MLIITGPGRSGTSVLALFCQKMGYEPGGAWCDAVNAGLENSRIVRINDTLLRSLRQTGTIKQALVECREEMARMQIAVVKDPRFTYHPAVLRAWCTVRNDLTVLMTYRAPEHCIASRRRRSKFLLDPRSMSPDTIRCQFADSLETLLASDIRFQMLLFPNFLEQFDHVYDVFQKLELTMDRRRAEAVWAEIVNPSKVHFGFALAFDTDLKHRRFLPHPILLGAQNLWHRGFHMRNWLRDAILDDRPHHAPTTSEPNGSPSLSKMLR